MRSCLPRFLLSGWSGIPALQCCWREQTTAMCGCGRSLQETVKPSRVLGARPPAAKSCPTVREEKTRSKVTGTVFIKSRICMTMYVYVGFYVCLNVYLVFCLSPGKRAVVGYEDGTVRVWDLKQGNAIHVVKGEPGLHWGKSFWCLN